MSYVAHDKGTLNEAFMQFGQKQGHKMVGSSVGHFLDMELMPSDGKNVVDNVSRIMPDILGTLVKK